MCASLKFLPAPHDGIPNLHCPIAYDHVGDKEEDLETTKKSPVGWEESYLVFYPLGTA